MVYLKTYKLFESDIWSKKELKANIDLEDIKDIFSELKDNNLYVFDIGIGSAISMNGRKVITDPDDFDPHCETIDSVSLRLKRISDDGIIVDDDFFNELEYAIKHIESKYKLKVNSIFYRTTANLWVSSVKDLKEYLLNLRERDFQSKQKFLLYIDIIFEIL